MDKLKTLLKIINFQIKIFFSKLTQSGKITVNGNKLRCRCSSKGSFSCAKGSEISINRISIFDGFHFAAVDGGKIELGNNLFFNRNCTVVARQSIKIGDNCSFGPNVCIYDHDHAFGKAKQNGESFKTAEVSIGSNCWVGANTVILRGTVIGENCVIGAGCIVSGAIPSNSLVTAGRQLEIRQINNN